ncbi:MAG: sigma-70 family RNA polymerase sigma factor [Acidobacteria bacterium]|nr:sigma-70 family RNA polymerase sigma factor [Acidobacteriota bacterium]
MSTEGGIDLLTEIWPFRRVTAETEVRTQDDQSLVELARDGDRSAFGLLYDRHARMVHGLLLARVPRSEAEDLLHDVFIAALRQLNALRDGSAFGAWIARIARNRANDYHRRTPDVVELPEDLGGEEQPSNEAVSVLAVIRSLPMAYRETLILRLVEGMTGPEIAARTGLTPASVRVNLHRGMKLLREKLEGRTARA